MIKRTRFAALRVAGVASAAALVVVGCGGHGHSAKRETGPLRLASSAFRSGGAIPIDYSCAGADTSPPITWHGAAPSGTKTWALVLTDQDVRHGAWVQWVVTDLPVALRGLQAGQVPSHALVGKASNGTAGYVGVCPPAGKTHRYRFTIYAVRSSLPAVSTATQTLRLLADAAIAKTTLTAHFAR